MRIEPFTEEHDQLRAVVRRWVADAVTPHAAVWEATEVPRAALAQAGELGLLDTDLGGGPGGVHAADPWAAAVVAEELGRGCAALGALIGAQAALAIPLLAAASAGPVVDGLRERAAAGTAVVAVARAASDLRARATEDGWILDGEVGPVLGAGLADVLLVVVDDRGGTAVLSVAADAVGVAVTPHPTAGARGAATAAVTLDGALATPVLTVDVTPDDVLRPHRRADGLLAAARAVGATAALLERATTYAADRQAFGRPIGTFQVQRHRLAALSTRLEGSRRLLHAAADAWARTGTPTPLALSAEVAATRTAAWAADEVVQLHGGLGYAEESGLPRVWRDTRLPRPGGTPLPLLVAAVADHVVAEDVAGAGQPLVPDATAPAAGQPGLEPVADPAHEAVRRRARALVAQEIAPHVDAWDATGDWPRALLGRVGDAGFLGLKFAADHGGTGPDLRAQAVWVEELARAGAAGLAADLGAHSDLAALYVDRAGTDEQRRRWLAPSIAGDVVGALAITEPDAGSDVAGTRTRARRDGDGWVLDGAKTYITNGSWADYVVVLATTDPDAGHAGKTLFVVPGDAAGLTRRRLRMLGWRSSHTGELALDGVVVDDGARLGEVGAGFLHVMRNFAWERVSMALGAVVAAEGAVAAALARVEDGTAPGPAEVWRDRLGLLAVRTAEGRALSEHALRVAVAGRDEAAVEAAKAKLLTQRLAVEACEAALEVHGGAGSPAGAPVDRWLRDARLGPIGGGTDEVMAEIVGRAMGF